MTQIQKDIKNSPLTDLRSSIEDLISEYTNRCSEVFEALARPSAPLGANLLESDHQEMNNLIGNGSDAMQNDGFGLNRYSVLYTVNGQYQHIGCSSQEESQSVLANMMTDEFRIPIGIYDEKTDLFEWEMIGQYFHSMDPENDQRERQNEVMNVVRALRRRDSSWEPGILQRPSFFA